MSGHSKWSTIKRKKGAIDQKRGRIFSRLAKEITVAAKIGGGDPEGNPRLRTVLLSAKSQNMPKDNVERAIKKGTGEIEGVSYEEIRYECYGAGGVALIVSSLTDNKKRTVSEIRHILSRNGGSLAESGAVLWNFDQKGYITVERGTLTEDELFEKAIEAGADDVVVDEESVEIYTASADLHAVAGALEAGGLVVQEAKLTLVPKTTVAVDEKTAEQVLKCIDALEDNDDVQDVVGNFDISEEVMAALAE